MLYSKSTGGFYDIKIHGNNIPNDAVEIIDEDYTAIFSAQSTGKSIVAGDDGYPIAIDQPPLTVPEQKLAKLAEINVACENAIAAVRNGYPESEILSWTKQEIEARGWLANNNINTPFIDALAAARSVDKADLVNRIITKVDIFTQLSGTIIGKRQALEDAVNDLPEDATPDQIGAIQW